MRMRNVVIEEAAALPWTDDEETLHWSKIDCTSLYQTIDQARATRQRGRQAGTLCLLVRKRM